MGAVCGGLGWVFLACAGRFRRSALWGGVYGAGWVMGPRGIELRQCWPGATQSRSCYRRTCAR
jgi:hypothetical protein